MSIHPQYGDAILVGKKRIEFRKRPVHKKTHYVLLYATLPVAAIVGAFSVLDQLTGSPFQLWDDYSELGAIAKEDFNAYYSNCMNGTGIRIGEVYRLEEPVGVYCALGISKAPQSYQYVDFSRAMQLISLMIRQ